MAKYKIPKNVVAVARDAVNDENVASKPREWRAFIREKVLARRVLVDDATKRKLRERIRELEDGLVRACDLAIDAADVIADANILEPEDGEDDDFRSGIAELRALSKQPEATRHVARRKQQAEEGLAIAIAEVERTGKGYPLADSTADADEAP